jgi:transposase InsO family protein
LVVSNVLNREFVVDEPSKALVSDSTYIHTKARFLYLATVMNLYDRKIIGSSLSDEMSTEETALASWKTAVTDRTPEKGLIFYSYRGIQYASKKFTNVIDSYKIIKRSMSRKGNYWYNAAAESFFKALKIQQIYGDKLKTKDQMKLDIFEDIEIFYIRKEGIPI